MHLSVGNIKEVRATYIYIYVLLYVHLVVFLRLSFTSFFNICVENHFKYVLKIIKFQYIVNDRGSYAYAINLHTYIKTKDKVTS